MVAMLPTVPIRTFFGRSTGLLLAVTAVLVLETPEEAAQANPGTVSATATLSVLAGTVQHVPNGTTQPQPAKDGMGVAVGDRVLTGGKSFAVITFLDGSALVVCPNTDVTVKRADVSGTQRDGIGIKINLGLVWARVSRLLDRKPSFSLEANTMVASVHDGLIGAKQNADGSFECWTKAGEVTIQDRFNAEATLVMQPGRKVKIEPGFGKFPAQEPFAVNQSSLKITASSAVLPLLLMAEKARVAGFVAPGIEVNQVLGSLTGLGGSGERIIDVPAGAAGPYALALEGLRDGPFTVEVVGFFKGNEVYRHNLSGTIRKGARLSAEILQTMDPASGDEPKTAKVTSATVSPLRPLEGALPGNVLLSPAEMQTVSAK
jgi:hypothetical protein